MRLRFDVFGRRVDVVRRGDGWTAFYPGTDGKRRAARDITIPPDVDAAALQQYLDDLRHEWATPEHPAVIQLQ
jgi:hypothetical protein